MGLRTSETFQVTFISVPVRSTAMSVSDGIKEMTGEDIGETDTSSLGSLARHHVYLEPSGVVFKKRANWFFEQSKCELAEVSNDILTRIPMDGSGPKSIRIPFVVGLASKYFLLLTAFLGPYGARKFALSNSPPLPTSLLHL